MREQLLELLPRLRRFSYALTGTWHDADDLTQTSIERLLSRRVPDGADLQRWAFRVCKNVWIDELRARRVRNHTSDDDVMSNLCDDDGESTAMNWVTLNEVNMAMRRLPDGQRAALALVAVEGYSYAEAAETLEVPIGTIMSRIARARRGLAAMLAPAASHAP